MESNELLKQIIANQTVMFEKLSAIENKLNNSQANKSAKAHYDELSKKASEVIPHIK